MRRKTSNNKAFCVRLPKATRKALDAIAKRKDIPAAQIVRAATKEYIERNRPAATPAEA